MNGRVELMRVLVEAEAPVEAETSKGLTPLYLTVQHGHMGAAQLLVQLGANVNARSRRGCTPWQLICSKNWQKLFEPLLQNVELCGLDAR